MAKRQKHRARPEKPEKRRRIRQTESDEVGPFVFKQRLSKRTASILPSAQFECVGTCPVYDKCDYADPGVSCGVLNRYIEDVERELLMQMETPLPASYALLLGNTLRMLAALAWADIYYYYSPPCSAAVRIEEDEDEEFEVHLVIFQDSFAKNYMTIQRAVRDNLEALALTRRRLTAPGSKRGSDGKGDESLHEVMEEAGVQRGPKRPV